MASLNRYIPEVALVLHRNDRFVSLGELLDRNTMATKELKMKNRLLITSLACALPFFSVSAQVIDDDNVLGQDVVEERQDIGLDQERQEEVSGEVIDRDSKTLSQEAGDISEREVNRGSTDVEYQTKRQVTKTLLQQEEIPTIQVCETKANINEMDQKDFQALGFDQNTAERIVQQREQQGQFSSVDELAQIQGLSQDALAKVRDDLGVNMKQAQEEK